MKIKLVCTSALATPREITVEEFPVAIGRGSSAAVRIEDRWISRQHCELTLEEDVFYVRDLESRHGTMVNGQRIAKAPLADGDVLQLGLTQFRVEHIGPSIHDSAEFAAVGF